MGYLKTTAMAVMAAVVLLLATVAEAQEQTCINKLVPCYSSLNSTKPSETCCSSIKEAVATDLACLCNIYSSPDLLKNLGVSLDQALNLTKACNVPSDLSKCNSTLSPHPQPPAAVPGSGNDGAETIAWTGVSTLCLLFVSMLFF